MFSSELKEKLIAVARCLISQEQAEVLVWPHEREQGFWFGSGNICREPGGDLLLTGRYRNGGDSRSGLEAGPRGAELLVLSSSDGGKSFKPIHSFRKRDLSYPQNEVLSIEGSCLYASRAGLELFVSSEKRADYPEAVRQFQKPGTGVWSIDVMAPKAGHGFNASGIKPAFRSEQPAWLHVKDPIVFDLAGKTTMLYCSHPFTWASGNSGCAAREAQHKPFVNRDSSILSRGPAWDVAACRITERLPLPPTGILKGLPRLSLYFYDGAECMHSHGKNTGADGLSRGYSCEEVGGLAVGFDRDFPRLVSLSVERPLFTSPYGTGCSRYVSVFDGGEFYLATWQQSQPDRCQPLVVNRVDKKTIENIVCA